MNRYFYFMGHQILDDSFHRTPTYRTPGWMWATVLLGIIALSILCCLGIEEMTPSKFFQNLIIVALSVPILGFLLGLLLAVAPFLNLSYSEKYVSASLWAMMGIILFTSLGLFFYYSTLTFSVQLPTPPPSSPEVPIPPSQ